MNKHDIDEYNLSEKMTIRLNKLFTELNKEYNLKNGDLNVDQTLIFDSFVLVLTDYIIQNSKEVKND